MTDRVVVFRGGALPTAGVSPGDMAAEASARAAADTALTDLAIAGDTIRLTYSSGDGDAAVYAIHADQTALTIGINSILQFDWPGTNTASNPTLTIGATAYTLKARSGAAFASGEVKSGEYIGRVAAGNAIRILGSTRIADVPGLSERLDELDAKAPLASPALTGTPTAPTAAAGTNTTQIATSAFVQAAVAAKAPLASPALTGTPTAPTAAAGTETAQVATTGFVAGALRDASITTDALAYTTGGELFNGGVLYDSGRGIEVPAGYTGRNSYRRWHIADADLADLVALAGQTIEIEFEIATSSNLSALTPLTLAFSTLDGAIWTNEAAPVTVISQTATSIVGRAQYTILGTEDAIAPWAQVSASAQVRGAAGHFAITRMTVAWPQGANSAFDWRAARAINAAVPGMIAAEVDPQIATLTDRVAQAEITAGPLNVTTEGEALNGVVISNGGLTMTIPIGQHGRNAYRRAVAAMGPPAVAGQLVTFRLALDTSANVGLESPITVRLAVQHGAVLDSYAATATVTSIDSTHLVAEVDYVIVGDETAFHMWYQISNAAAVRTTTGAITLGEFTFALTSVASSPTTADLMLDYKVRRVVSEGVPDLSGLTDRVAQAEITSGELDFATDGELFSGATVSGDGLTLTVPAGQHGQNSYRRAVVGIAAPGEAGHIITWRLSLTTSANLTDDTPLTAALAVKRGGVWNNYGASATVTEISDTELLVQASYTLIGDEEGFAPWAQVSGAAVVRTATGSITYGPVRFALASGASVPTSADLMLDYRIGQSAGGAPGEVAEVASRGAVYIKVVDVAADGSGDYPDLTTAFLFGGGGQNAARRALYRLHEGIYTDINVDFPNFVDVVGIGRRDHIWYKGELPADVDPAQVPLNETFSLNRTSTIRNLRVSCRNMRYPIHSESGASDNFAIQHVIGCLVENYGNQAVIDYQVGIGNPAPALWGSAMGCGGHSGMLLRSVDTIWRAPLGPFFVHSNASFEEPMDIVLEGGAAINTLSGHAVSLQPMGAGVVTHVRIVGCNLAGPIYVDGSDAWLTNDLGLQWGNRLSEFLVTTRDCGPVLARGNNGVSVLELRSAAGAGSAVALSGAAAPILFGARPDYRGGAVDHAGRVYSQHAVTGTAPGVTLAERLGNRSGAPITLTVAFDGGASTDIVLSANYTGMSNAAVVAALNAALADGSRGFYLSDPYSGGGCVRQADFDREVKNVGASTIKRGMAVASSGSKVRARVMTGADPAWRFVGIALEDIIPGATGRLRGPGTYIDSGDLLFSGTPAIAEGDTFGVSISDGMMTEGATVPLVRCIWTSGYTAFQID
ncbi:hypothetical protein IQ03_04977 [Gemmobacter caeni]|uniref:Uncharacterized protein n=1 Tax=Gemmobacter caeni TaxID=589035 RepID=A0A2T6A6J5_9RHOB|nr:hypothetical protein [Gemmobacter caeni]PTX39406.1 hypothetical protein C8N34_1389 [Gemmobacter caeni]TWI90013.1 hypothetical protein IQ03_04977 [Gemmobacter caeni]